MRHSDLRLSIEHLAQPPSAERRRWPSGAPTKHEAETFLDCLAAGWSVAHAARQAGLHRQRLYEARASSGSFARRWAQAYESGTDALEDEAKRRAVEGWDEPVFQKGELVGYVRKYSDRLLEVLLRARRYGSSEQARVDVHVSAGAVPPRRVSLTDVLELAAELGVEIPERYQGRPLELDALELPAAEEGPES